MDNINEKPMYLENLKLKGLGLFADGKIFLATWGYGLDKSLYEYNNLCFDPDIKLWRNLKENGVKYIKLGFKKYHEKKGYLKDSQGKIYSKSEVSKVLKSKRIYFVSREEKYRVIGVDEYNAFFVIPVDKIEFEITKDESEEIAVFYSKDILRMRVLD